MKIVSIKNKKSKAIKRGHPWVFSGAIASVSENVFNGDYVNVVTEDNQFLGEAHFTEGAAIALRMLHFEKTNISEYNLLSERLNSAINYRKELVDLNTTNLFRLVHGEGDFLPGLIIDQYNNNLVIQCHSWGMYRNAELISKLLLEKLPETANIYLKASESLHDNTIENKLLFGNDEKCIAKENNVNYNIDWVNGQKTGFFIDQRENRKLVAQLAKGKNVLNCFSYSGGFSLSALQGEAKSVLSTDISEHAINLCEENLKLNDFNGDHNSQVIDTLEYLKNNDLQEFDIVILDPPAYAKSKHSRHKAVQAYKRLNALAMRKMKPNSLLFTFSCSQVVEKQLFKDTIVAAAIEANKQVRIVSHLEQANCHPVNINHPEGEYLKGLLLQIE